MKTFVPQAATLTGRVLDEYILTGHDRHWRSDLQLMADIGVRWLRYGIPWYRVNPAPDVFDWSWTDAVLPFLVEDLGISPILDLVHYGAPLWLEGTFLSPDYPSRVEAYAAAVAERYGAIVRQWTPLNEPLVHAHFAGRIGAWPPYRRGDRGFAQVLAALARGMVRTIRAVRLRSRWPSSCTSKRCRRHGSRSCVRRAGRAGRSNAVRAAQPDRRSDGHPSGALWRWLSDGGVPDPHLRELAASRESIDVFGANFYPQMSCVVLDQGVEDCAGGGGAARPTTSRPCSGAPPPRHGARSWSRRRASSAVWRRAAVGWARLPTPPGTCGLTAFHSSA